MTELTATMRKLGGAPTPVWVVGAGAAAVAVWAALTFAPAAVALLVAASLAAAFGAVAYRAPAIGVVGLVAAAALDVTGRIGSFGGVIITVYQAAAFVMVLVVALRVFNGGDEWRPTRADLPVALLLASAAFAIPFAVSLRGTLVPYASLLSSVVLLYVVTQLVTDDARTATVEWGLLGIAATLGLLGLAERFRVYAIGPVLRTTLDGIRATATFDDPNILGAFLAAAAAYGLAWALTRASVRERVLAWSMLAAVLAGLFVTFSRGAWAGAAVACAVVLFISPVRTRTKLAILVAAGVAALVAAASLDPEWVRQKITDVANNPSAFYRLHMAEASIRMALDHPFGVGPGMFPVYFEAYRDAWTPVGLVESHITYATVLVEAGFAGLAGLLWLIWRYARSVVSAWRSGSPSTRALAVGATGAAVSLLLQAFTYSLETSKILWLTFGLGLAAAAMIVARKKES